MVSGISKYTVRMAVCTPITWSKHRRRMHARLFLILQFLHFFVVNIKAEAGSVVNGVHVSEFLYLERRRLLMNSLPSPVFSAFDRVLVDAQCSHDLSAKHIEKFNE